MHNYFINIDGENEGPFNLEEMLERSLLPDIKVWRDDQEDWLTAADFSELADATQAAKTPPPLPPPISDPISAPSDSPLQTEYADPQSNTLYTPPDFTPAAPPLYQRQGIVPPSPLLVGQIKTSYALWLSMSAINFALAMIGIFILVAIANHSRSSPSDVEAALNILGVSMVIFAILALIFLYRVLYLAWQSLENYPYSRTTPGRAVGFLFIPFFSLYWQFVAFHGWAQDMNQYIKGRQLPTQKRANEGLMIAHCVLNIGMLIPWLNVILMLPWAIITILCATNLRNTTVAMIRAHQQGDHAPLPPKQGL